MNTENNKKPGERGASENTIQGDQGIKPIKNYDVSNLIGAQIKIPYQNKMDNDSFPRT